jgi:putative FmdB family regulatory protein
MPIYEYHCLNCDKNFEKIQKFSDEPLTTHPECGGPVERLLSAPAFQFKGSGWYITDYNKTGSSSPASSGGKEPASEKPPAEKKAETKSETKAATPAATTTSTTSTSDK